MKRPLFILVSLAIVAVTAFTFFQTTNAASKWDVSNATYTNKSFSVAGQTTTITGGFLSATGTYAYASAQTEAAVLMYRLNTPWDLSTVVHMNNECTGVTNIRNFVISNDGTKMFVIIATSNLIAAYTLSTPWDVSTCTASTTLSVASQDTTPFSIAMSDDGTRIYVGGFQNGKAYQYNLTNPFYLSTASYASKSLTLQNNGPRGLVMGNNGSSIYELGGNGIAYEYDFSTPLELDTATYASKSLDMSAQDATERGLYASSTSATTVAFYQFGADNNKGYEYTSVGSTPAASSPFYVQTGGKFIMTRGKFIHP